MKSKKAKSIIVSILPAVLFVLIQSLSYSILVKKTDYSEQALSVIVSCALLPVIVVFVQYTSKKINLIYITLSIVVVLLCLYFCRLEIVYILVICAIVPINEELIYRKLAYKNAVNEFGVVLPTVISSLLFGIAHTGLLQMLMAFILGMFLCEIVRRTNTISIAIVIHSVLNIIGLIIMRI